MIPARVPFLHLDIPNGFVLRQSQKQSDIHINYNKRIKISVLWDPKSCTSVDWYKRSAGTWCLFILRAGLWPTFCNDESKLFRNVGTCIKTNGHAFKMRRTMPFMETEFQITWCVQKSQRGVQKRRQDAPRKHRWLFTNKDRFIMFSMITNIYNKKLKGPNLM